MPKNAEFFMLAKAQSKGRKFIIELLLFFAVFFVTTMVSSILLEIPLVVDFLKGFLKTGNLADGFVGLNNFASSQWFILLSLFATIVTTLGTILYCTKIEKRSLLSMGFSRKGIAKEYLMGYGIGAGTFVIAILICVAAGTAKISFSGGNIGLILLFFLGYLIQGMSEEVLVRGFFMVSVARKNSVLCAVIWSSVIFALLHIFNSGLTLLALVNLALYGVEMALYMIVRGDIWGVCAIHSAWNFVQGNIFGVRVSGMPVCESLFTTEMFGSHWINGGSFGIEGGLAETFVSVAVIVILLIIARKRRINFKNLPEIEEGSVTQ